jgi:hypothetical protein
LDDKVALKKNLRFISSRKIIFFLSGSNYNPAKMVKDKNNTRMVVKKRDGREEFVHFDKITSR